MPKEEAGLAEDAFLGSKHIGIEDHHGVVVLTGSLAMRQQRHRAEMVAYAAGARIVINRLRVNSP